MKDEKGEMLTTSQVAERLGVGRSTVNLWCRQGKFPNAEPRQEVIGTVWYVPVNDLENFIPPKMGRPPKAQSAPAPAKRATGQQRGTIASQTKTTRKLDRTIKRAADSAMGGKKKGGLR